MSMGSEKSDDDEESEDDGEEMDCAPGAYVSLFAVASRMQKWYVNGARECPEDHLMLQLERATNVFETLVPDDGITTATTDGRFRQLAAIFEEEKALPRAERRSRRTIEDLQGQVLAIAGASSAKSNSSSGRRTRRGRTCTPAPSPRRRAEKPTKPCVFDPLG